MLTSNGFEKPVVDARLSGLPCHGQDGVDSSINVRGYSDFVSSDEHEHLKELGGHIEKKESGHVGHNSGQIEGVVDDSSAQSG
jgi:hypothetical protein